MIQEKHELEKIVSGDKKEGKKMQLVRNMGLWTGVSIIIGNVIGGGIFVSPVGVFSQVGSPGAALLVWAICGILCITGKTQNKLKSYSSFQEHFVMQNWV